jgi:hypothetical protein
VPHGERMAVFFDIIFFFSGVNTLIVVFFLKKLWVNKDAFDVKFFKNLWDNKEFFFILHIRQDNTYMWRTKEI